MAAVDRSLPLDADHLRGDFPILRERFTAISRSSIWTTPQQRSIRGM